MRAISRAIGGVRRIVAVWLVVAAFTSVSRATVNPESSERVRVDFAVRVGKLLSVKANTKPPTALHGQRGMLQAKRELQLRQRKTHRAMVGRGSEHAEMVLATTKSLEAIAAIAVVANLLASLSSYVHGQ